LEDADVARFVRKRLANGSAPDLAGWSGEHVSALVDDEVCLAGITALTLDIANGSLGGEARALLLASKLIAVRKDVDDIRPIAMGATFYKLAALMSVASVKGEFKVIFDPIQLGVGCEGGSERASLLIRSRKDACGPGGCVVSCDFKNAFNTRDRAGIVEAMFKQKQLAPVWRIFHWAYRAPSRLIVTMGGGVIADIPSSDGVRQGDPLSSLGYGVSVHPVYQEVDRAHPNVLVVAIVDDLTLSGPADDVADAFEHLVKLAKDNHMPLNVQKSKFFGPSGPDGEACCKRLSALGLRQCVDGMSVLGVPLGYNRSCPVGTDEASIADWAIERVMNDSAFYELIANELLPVQQAMLLLRVCGLPKVNFISRSLPPRVTMGAMLAFDERIVRAALLKLGLSSSLPSDSALKQLALPISRSGFGLRRFELTCFPAFWGATAQSAVALSNALHTGHADVDLLDLVGPELKADLTACHGRLLQLGVPPSPPDADPRDLLVPFPRSADDFWALYTSPLCRTKKLQREFTHCIEQVLFRSLKNGFGFAGQARLLACSMPNAGAWILACPSESSLVMSDDDFRLASFLRLGISQPALPTLCSCGKPLAGTSDHGLSCHQQRGRSVRFRHDAIVRTLGVQISHAGGVVQVEPYDLQVDHGVRPDLTALLISSNLAADAQITHPACATHCRRASTKGLWAAEQSEKAKCSRYVSMASVEGLDFYPFSMESFGGIGSKSSKLLKLVAKQSALTPGCSVSLSYLVQTLSVCLQRGNARILRDTLWRSLQHARLH
jgi:hypothetical protein